MNDQPESSLSAARTVGLTGDERAAMRRLLLAHISANAPRPGFLALVGRHAFAYGLAVLVILVGATTALADHAGPGSFLYPVRLAVNDRVAVAVAGDADAQTDVELSQIGRMIDDESGAAQGDIPGEDETPTSQVRHEGDTTQTAGDELDSIDQDLQQTAQDTPPEN